MRAAAALGGLTLLAAAGYFFKYSIDNGLIGLTARVIIGAVIGVAGLVTLVPQLELVGAIFGLGLIVWFVWAGLVLPRRDANRRDSHEPAPAGRR